MRNKVIVAGHACLDITPVFPSNISAGAVGDILSPGRLVQMNGVDIHTGGAVSNTGLAMKILGTDVSLMAKTGDDVFGKIISDIYRQYHAEQGIIKDPEGSTSYSAVLALPGVDRVFLHDPGCNNTFSFSDVQKADLDDVIMFHFGYPPLMKKMYEDDGKELVQIMRYMKERNIVTSLDLAFVDESSEAGMADWKKILSNTLPYVDFFVPSIEELCCMLDHARYEEWKKRAKGMDLALVLEPMRDIKPLADLCLEYGAKAVILKCGAPGFYYKTACIEKMLQVTQILNRDAAEWSGREGFEKSYVPDRILSATGAGDTTIAAFLAAVLQGYSFETCLHLAAAEGASCITEYDALSGIRSLSELKKRIQSGWTKQDFSKNE